MKDTRNEIMKVFKELLPEAQRTLVMCAGSAKSAEAMLYRNIIGRRLAESVCGSTAVARESGKFCLRTI